MFKNLNLCEKQNLFLIKKWIKMQIDLKKSNYLEKLRIFKDFNIFFFNIYSIKKNYILYLNFYNNLTNFFFNFFFIFLLSFFFILITFIF